MNDDARNHECEKKGKTVLMLMSTKMNWGGKRSIHLLLEQKSGKLLLRGVFDVPSELAVGR
jgi:hypothetical protein